MNKNLILPLPIFFVTFTSTSSYKLFQAMILCNLKENKWTKLEKTAKNFISGVSLVRLIQIWIPKFFLWVLSVLHVHCNMLSSYSISQKTYDPNSKNGKKTHFRTDFSLFGRNSSHQNLFIKLVVRYRYPKHSSYAIYRKINKSNLRKWWKTYFQAQFWPICPKFGPPKFFWGFYLY